MKNNAYFKLISLTKPYKKYVACNLFFNLMTVCFSLVSLIMIVPFLQLIFDIMPMVENKPTLKYSTDYIHQTFYYYLSEQIRVNGKSGALILFCFQVIGVFFFKNFFRYVANYVLAPVKNGVVKDLRQSLYDKILTSPLQFFHIHRKGDLITKMTSDLREIEYGVMCTIETMVVSPLTIILFLSYLFFSNPMLTSFVLAMVLIMALFVGRIGKSLKKDTIEGQTVLSNVTSIIDETIGGIKAIMGFNAQEKFKSLFSQQNQNYYSIFNRMYRKKDLSSPLTEFLVIIIVCCILWFGGSLALGTIDLGPMNKIKPEAFIAYMVVFSQLIAPAKSFSNAFYEIQKGLAGYMRIKTILDYENPIKEIEKPKRINVFNHQIEFKNVHFHYQKEKPILQDINLTIQKGKVIALVGSSGAGKSTLVDLLPRFYDVCFGEICIDGIDIKQYAIEDLRNLMGIVTQEALLFNQSIQDNIAINDTDPNLPKIDKALETANAKNFVYNKTNNIHQMAGERGGLFSGGEKQRLTIARAVYKNPPILILDEATSALDSENEKMVQESIQKLMQGRTCIIIAHRLATIQHADEILVLDKGKIVARGNHEYLMNQSVLYKKMVQLQAFD